MSRLRRLLLCWIGGWLPLLVAMTARAEDELFDSLLTPQSFLVHEADLERAGRTTCHFSDSVTPLDSFSQWGCHMIPDEPVGQEQHPECFADPFEHPDRLTSELFLQTSLSTSDMSDETKPLFQRPTDLHPLLDGIWDSALWDQSELWLTADQSPVSCDWELEPALQSELTAAELIMPIQGLVETSVVTIPPEKVPDLEKRDDPPSTQSNVPATAGNTLWILGPLGPVWGEYWDWAQGGVNRWTERLEFGGTFLEGNTQQETFNTAARFSRDLETTNSQINLGGQYSQSHGAKTANRWFGDTTTDFKRTGKWILFLRSLHAYNEFERLDYRGTGSLGFGYRFLNDEQKKLIVRTGPGATIEVFHGPIVVRTTADWFAEFESKWPLGKRIVLEEKATLNPSLRNLELMRVLNTAGLLIPLDDQKRWNLKFGFRYEYNGQPPVNRVRSDYTTTVNIVYSRK